jgi:hypothetical protein
MASNSGTLQKHQSAIVVAALVAAAGFIIPPVHWLMLPLQYLNTHLHELCHALTAVATGGQPEWIKVYSNGSGLTPIFGGNKYLEISAGYPGATIVGAAMIYFGRTPERAKIALYAISGMLLLSMILWVRGDAVGVVSGLFWMAALFLGGRFLQGGFALFVCQLIGLEQCLNSVSSVSDLLKISLYSTEAQSDAATMQSFTYIPATAWATLWCLFSLLMIGVTLRKAWTQKTTAATVSNPSA